MKTRLIDHDVFFFFFVFGQCRQSVKTARSWNTKAKTRFCVGEETQQQLPLMDPRTNTRIVDWRLIRSRPFQAQCTIRYNYYWCIRTTRMPRAVAMFSIVPQKNSRSLTILKNALTDFLCLYTVQKKINK